MRSSRRYRRRPRSLIALRMSVKIMIMLARSVFRKTREFFRRYVLHVVEDHIPDWRRVRFRFDEQIGGIGKNFVERFAQESIRGHTFRMGQGDEPGFFLRLEWQSNGHGVPFRYYRLRPALMEFTPKQASAQTLSA